MIVVTYRHLWKMLVLSTSLFLTLALLNAQPDNSKPIRLDVIWWNHQLHDEEREAFVAGYLDCRQIPHSARASYADYVDFVRSHITNDANSAPQTIELAAHQLKSKPILKGGEVWLGAHGFLDGGYWGSGGPAQTAWRDTQQGFIEGYLACRMNSITPHVVDRYVNKLDQHYANPSHEHDKISNVLERYLADDQRAKPQ